MTGFVDRILDREHHKCTRFIVDLVGPSVVHFVGGAVCVNVPMCTDHHANVQTDHDDVSLFGVPTTAQAAPIPPKPPNKGFIYTLTGPVGSDVGDCDGLDNGHNGFLVVNDPTIEPVSENLCHLVIKLPRPNQILPLIREWVFLHQNGADTWIDPDNGDCQTGAGGDSDDGDAYIRCKYARGLRFVYLDCPAQPAIALTAFGDPEPPADFPQQLYACNFNADGYDPVQYHLTLRFASNSTAPDENHEDAYNCFQTIRTLVPKALLWRVDFDDTYVTAEMVQKVFPEPGRPHLHHHSGPNPLDCNASVAVVQSEG